MTIEASIRQALLDDANISALVSSRIYPIILPQNPTIPAMTVRVENEDLIDIFGGQSELLRMTLNVDCWQTTFTDADVLRTYVRNALNNYSGIVLGLEIHRIRYADRVDVFEEVVDAYRATAIFDVWFYEE